MEAEAIARAGGMGAELVCAYARPPPLCRASLARPRLATDRSAIEHVLAARGARHSTPQPLASRPPCTVCLSRLRAPLGPPLAPRRGRTYLTSLRMTVRVVPLISVCVLGTGLLLTLASMRVGAWSVSKGETLRRCARGGGRHDRRGAQAARHPPPCPRPLVLARPPAGTVTTASTGLFNGCLNLTSTASMYKDLKAGHLGTCFAIDTHTPGFT